MTGRSKKNLILDLQSKSGAESANNHSPITYNSKFNHQGREVPILTTPHFSQMQNSLGAHS